MNKKYYLRLCIKDATGDINKSEKQLLENWLSESQDRNKEYEKIKMIWKNSSHFTAPELPDAESEWEKLYDRIMVDMSEYRIKNSQINNIRGFFETVFKQNLKPAISGAVVILIIIAGIYILNKEEYIPKIISVSTANKEHKSVALSDGSTVELNNASSIEFAEMFSEKVREVKLKGEAFFSVTKDRRPFKVITDNANTTVLGTKFNIWTRGEITRVIVKEGSVSLSPKKENTNGVVLTKNQSSTIIQNQEPTPPKNVNTDYLLGWMNGKLTFYQTPLNEIVDELVIHYDIPIYLENNSLRNYTLTGSFRNKEVDSVLTMICLSLDLEFVKHLDGFLIRNKK